MDLSRIDIKLEKRSNAEAAQLGFVIARRYFASLAIASALPIIPFYLLACLLLFVEPIWAFILVWWMKPFYERVILFNLSRLIFSEQRDFAQILTSIREASKNGLWLNLTFFRFSPTRGVSMCLQVLEGLKGKDYSKRRNYILMTVGGGASALLIGLVHFEGFIYLNLIALLTISNDNANIGFYLFTGQELDISYLAEWLALSCYVFALWLVEIFYVSANFMLYINRRVELEGWDIEIAFKKMAEKYAGLINKSFGFAVLIAATLFLTAPNISYAEPANIDPEADKVTLQTIIDNEEPSPYEVKGRWKMKPQEAKEEPEFESSNNFWRNLDLSFMGILLKLAALGLLAWLVYLVVSSRASWLVIFSRKPKAKVEKTPGVVLGMQLSKESLPPDIIAEVKRLIGKGKLTEALSLLYRGTLSDLVYSYEIDIHESYTEGDCLRIARRKIAPAAYAYFSQLTKAWQTMVYAHKPVSETSLLGLSGEWASYFNSPKDHQQNSAERAD